jgi:HPt (histidine-containing phosphotransfer) domain-containing protein
MESANISDNDPPTVIHSEYESEPAIAEILNVFTDSLPGMIGDMCSSLQGGDGTTLASLAHQLKGSGGGYGYPMLTAVSAQLEQAAKEEDWEIAATYVTKIDLLCAAILRGRALKTGGQT